MQPKLRLLAFLTGFALALGLGLAMKAHGLSFWAGQSAQAASAASAGYSLDSASLAPGGGRAAGGDYTLYATSGRPDSGEVSGGGFQLQGGFLPGTLSPYRLQVPLVKK